MQDIVLSLHSGVFRIDMNVNDKAATINLFDLYAISVRYPSEP